MVQERIYEEPIRFFGCNNVPKQIQEYRKQRLQQLVECECGDFFLMKDTANHVESDCHFAFKEEERMRKELEEPNHIENDTDSDIDNYSDGGSTRVLND